MFIAAAAGCSHAGGTPPITAPPGTHGGPPPASPTPHATATASTSPSPSPSPSSTPFNVASVHVTEHRIPVNPLYLAVGTDNTAYFGFGSGGTGSNLYRYVNGSVAQTAPGDPPNGYDPGGGVYGITVTNTNQVFWLSAYLGPDFSISVQVECGGNGGKASICEPTVDEPTSTLVASNGTFWVGGISFEGGGIVTTSSNASGTFGASVMQLVNGPDRGVWALLDDDTSGAAQYGIGELTISGTAVNLTRFYALPDADSISSMTLGGDGNFWFTDQTRNAIGRMSPAGHIDLFTLADANALGPPWFGQWQITTACDGAVWFTEPGVNKVGRMDAKGTLSQFALPSANADPGPIAAAPLPIGTCLSPQVWVGEQHTNILAAISY